MNATLVPFPTRTQRAITISQKYAKLVLHLEHGLELWTRQFNASGSPTRRRELGAVIHELSGALAVAGIQKACPCGCQRLEQ